MQEYPYTYVFHYYILVCFFVYLLFMPNIKKISIGKFLLLDVGTLWLKTMHDATPNSKTMWQKIFEV